MWLPGRRNLQSGSRGARHDPGPRAQRASGPWISVRRRSPLRWLAVARAASTDGRMSHMSCASDTTMPCDRRRCVRERTETSVRSSDSTKYPQSQEKYRFNVAERKEARLRNGCSP